MDKINVDMNWGNTVITPIKYALGSTEVIWQDLIILNTAIKYGRST